MPYLLGLEPDTCKTFADEMRSDRLGDTLYWASPLLRTHFHEYDEDVLNGEYSSSDGDWKEWNDHSQSISSALVSYFRSDKFVADHDKIVLSAWQQPSAKKQGRKRKKNENQNTANKGARGGNAAASASAAAAAASAAAAAGANMTAAASSTSQAATAASAAGIPVFASKH